MDKTRVLGFVVALMVLPASAAFAQSLQAQTEKIVRSAKLGKGEFGVLVADLAGGENPISIGADQPMSPASNLKLLTSAAALSRLGKDFIFSTQLLVDENNLIVRGGGDPALGDPVILAEMGLTMDHVLDRWVDAAVKKGVARFDSLLVDDRIFDAQFVHPHWPANQLLNYYCAPVGAINFNDNCVDFFASPTTTGKPPRIRLVPEGIPMEVANSALSGSGKPALTVDRKPGTSRLIVAGKIAKAMVNPTWVTVDDPAMSFAGLLKNRLKRAGVEVGQVRRFEPGEDIPRGRLIAAVETPIATVLMRTNRDSMNLFAEALLKRLGHEATGGPGGWANGTATVHAFLREAVGASADTVVMDDGSGLSKHNRVSPRAFVQLLEHMHADKNLGPIYRDSLAEPGEKGSLRQRLDDGELSGKLYAKSGYISGTYALSGYLEVGGRTLAFSMIANNSGGNPKAAMDKILIALDKYYSRNVAAPPPKTVSALGG